MKSESSALIRLALATMAALALTLAMTTATAGATPDTKPVIRSVQLKPPATDPRSVTVMVDGRRLQIVMACDLDANVCVRAHRTAPHRWSAVLPVASGSNAIGVIARSGGDYLFANAR
jgi:hypothetical protein